MSYHIAAVFKDGTAISETMEDRVAWAARYADLVHDLRVMYVGTLEDGTDGRPPIWHDKHYTGRETRCNVDGDKAANLSIQDWPLRVRAVP